MESSRLKKKSATDRKRVVRAHQQVVEQKNRRDEAVHHVHKERKIQPDDADVRKQGRRASEKTKQVSRKEMLAKWKVDLRKWTLKRKPEAEEKKPVFKVRKVDRQQEERDLLWRSNSKTVTATGQKTDKGSTKPKADVSTRKPSEVTQRQTKRKTWNSSVPFVPQPPSTRVTRSSKAPPPTNSTKKGTAVWWRNPVPPIDDDDFLGPPPPMPDMDEPEPLTTDPTQPQPTTPVPTDITASTENSMPTDPPGSTEPEHDVKYFRALMASETEHLNTLSALWDKTNEETPDLNEDVRGQIRTTSDQAHLLIAQRFKQFNRLVDNCEFNTRLKPVDLQGFWDMIYYQVEDVNEKFNKLEKLKASGWVVEKPAVKKVAKKKNTASGKPSATVSARSKFAEFRAKMTQQQQKGEQNLSPPAADIKNPVTPKVDKTSPIIHVPTSSTPKAEDADNISDELKTFDGGLFQIASPVNIVLPSPTGSTPRKTTTESRKTPKAAESVTISCSSDDMDVDEAFVAKYCVPTVKESASKSVIMEVDLFEEPINDEEMPTQVKREMFMQSPKVNEEMAAPLPRTPFNLDSTVPHLRRSGRLSRASSGSSSKYVLTPGPAKSSSKDLSIFDSPTSTNGQQEDC